MAGIETLNPKAESAKQDVALEVTVSAAMGVHNVIKSNLGPKGTLKMLVSGAGDIKLKRTAAFYFMKWLSRTQLHL